ncbi:MAG: MauE/DoxX family redox-associated membrane protein [Alphaproteobacteria bacterium]
MSSQGKLKLSLAILRYTVAAFFAVWVIEKFVKPESTQGIWKAFYFVPDLPLEASYAIGVVQAVILICFVLGILKFWSYGLLLVMHALSTASTFGQLITPYTGNNHLFWAAVPALGALIALFILREEDTLGTVGTRG